MCIVIVMKDQMKDVNIMKQCHDEILPAARKMTVSYSECRNSIFSESWQQGTKYEVEDVMDQMVNLSEMYPAMITENSLQLVKKSMYIINKEEWLYLTHQLYEELQEYLLNLADFDACGWNE